MSGKMKYVKVNKGSLGRAVAIAVEAHAGQFDKSGADWGTGRRSSHSPYMGADIGISSPHSYDRSSRWAL